MTRACELRRTQTNGALAADIADDERFLLLRDVQGFVPFEQVPTDFSRCKECWS